MIVKHNPSRWVIVKVSRLVQDSKYIYNSVDAGPITPPPPGNRSMIFTDPLNSGYVVVLGA
jgi:hypothetical protein